MPGEGVRKKKKISRVLQDNLSEVRRRILADPIIEQVAEGARRQRVPLYLVGGVIRDLLLQRKVKDYDFALEKVKMPFLNQLKELLGASLFPMGKGKQERVYRLIKDGQTIDFAVMKGADIEDDLIQRDFTINAVAYAFAEGRFYADPNAIKDVKRGRIELVSPRALQGDPLRMLRAVRYRCTLPGFELTKQLKEEIKLHKELITGVAPERIRAELDQIILSPLSGQGLWLMYEIGLLSRICPELTPLVDLPQGRHHMTDVLSHTIAVVAEVNRLASKGNPFPFRPTEHERLIVGYAALFHDLGKPLTRSIDEQGEVHFYGHPRESSGLASKIMRRLKFSRGVREGVISLVENHMRILTLATGEPLDKALRRLIHAMGEEIKLLLLLGLAEKGSKGNGNKDEQERFRDLCRRIWALYEKENLIAPEPLLGGRDLLALGHASGPRLGEILKAVRERQIAGELRTREEALCFVREEYPP
jgi:poly(A) polymerase